MKRQYEQAASFMEHIGASFSNNSLTKYIEHNIKNKAVLNDLLGLNVDNGFTVTLPVLMDNETIKNSYRFLDTMFSMVLLNADYKDIDYVKGTIVNPKGQTIKITRVIPKFQEQIIKHPNYDRACRELGISDSSFASIGPRIGELANSSNQELFITSSIVEFMNVNMNSSYTSCYRHGSMTSTSYWTGTLSYGLDHFTLLVGIRNKDTKYKTGRSWLWLFSDGIDSIGTDMGSPFMVQPKSYGEFTTIHRKAVRAYIQKCIAPEATWKAGTKGTLSHSSRYGYIDNYDLTISWIKGEDKPNPRIEFYEDLWCLDCGSTYDLSDGDGKCYDCSEDGMYRCTYCGDSVHEDDCYYNPNGDCCCEHCWGERFFYCDNCGEDCTLDGSELVRARRYSGREVTERVCEGCIDSETNISFCEECNSYFFNANISAEETVEGDIVCESCVSGRCEECGLAFTSSSETTEINGYMYCLECADSIEEEEEDLEEAA